MENFENFRVQAKASRRAFGTAALGSALLGAASRAAVAQTFPTKPIRVICPFPGGGIVDIATRAIADALAADLGQPIISDPRPGAGGIIGSSVAASSAPDGHTWLMASVSHVAAPLFQQAPYDPVRDFRAAGVVAYGDALAVVPFSLQARSLAEFIALARAQPGQLNYLNPGNGSVAHLSSELLKLTAGIDLIPVEYRGLPQGLIDLLAGRLQFGIVSSALVIPHIQAGTLRVLGLANARHTEEMPEIKTFAEQGYANATIDSWMMVLLPAATPVPIVERVNVALARAILAPESRAKLKAASLFAATPFAAAAAQELLRNDHQRLAELVKTAKLVAR